MTPLPELCRRTADRTHGSVSGVFLKLSEELERQIAPDAACCMLAALAKTLDVPPKMEAFLTQLGLMLGQFDLQGQLQGIQGLKESCELARKGMDQNRPQRLRSYQTLGLCAGAAIAILFI
jgi:stage III sporulation protein AB